MQGEPGKPAVPPSVEATIAEVSVPVTPGGLILPSLRKPHRPRALERRRARRLRALRLPLLILTFLAIATVLVVARTLFVPLVLAAFVGMGLNPIVAGLQRIYVPRVLGALVIMIGLIVGLSEAAALLTAPAAEWIREAPQAIHQLAPKIRHMVRPLSAASHAASQSLAGFGVGSNVAPAGAAPSFGVSDLLLLAPRILAEALTVLLLVFFFLTYGDHMRRRLASASPRFAYRRIALKLVRGIQVEISRYLLTVTLINACLGALTAAILWGWQMPDPVLWGCVVALLNYMRSEERRVGKECRARWARD